MAKRSKKILRLTGLPRFGKAQRQRTPTSATVLELDGPFLRVVQSTAGASKTTISRIAEAKLEFANEGDRLNPELLGKQISKALGQLRLKTSSVVIGVPRSQVVLRTLQLPPLDRIDALASMVHFQVAKDLPFRLDEAVIDFKVGRKIPAAKPEGESKDPAAAEPGERVEILVAAVPREVVTFYQQMADAAGFKINALALLSHGTARFLQAGNLLQPGQATAVVALKIQAAAVDLIAEDTLVFSRDASLKYNPIEETPPGPSPENVAPPTAGDEAATPAAEKPKTFGEAATIEVIRTLHSYSGSATQYPVGHLLVTGATGVEMSVVESLRERVAIPCKFLEPGEILDIPPDSQELARKSLSAIGVAIASMDQAGFPFDFLNPKKPAVIRDTKRTKILLGVTAAAAVFVAILGIRTHLIRGKERVLKSAQAELSAEEKKLPIFRKTILQRTVIEGWFNNRENWLEHYALLSTLLPPAEEMYISSMGVTGQGGIKLSVQVKNGEVLAKLDKQLRAAGYDVKPIAVTPRADRFGYEFASNVEVTVPAKMKVDLAKTKPPPARPADDASLDPAVMKRGGG